MVFIKRLEKEIFPYYLPPEKDELFTSWFCRLSNNHDVKTNTFIQNYFGRNVPFWNRDIDVLEPENIINIMVKHTPLRIENIHEMFLKNYEGFAYYKYHRDGTIKNILPLGINHRKRKQFGQQCCTKCLSKGPVYFKKSWRLITSVVCTECNQLLIDRCYKCGSPITYFRVNMKSFSNLSTMEFQPLFLCSNCNTDLRKYEPNRIPTKLELEYQKYIDNSILNGFNSITQYSFAFIRILLLLSLRLRSSSKNNRFREIVLKKYNTPETFINKEVRYWSVDQRRETLPFIFSLFKNSTDELYSLFAEGKVMRAYLIKDNDYVPFWFEKLLYY
ncbi:MAG: TniQ family protein [Bacteroidales bacterium]|jgi:hypothetical protein|nr:TniQ family protein [Bacteroidales bacterium]